MPDSKGLDASAFERNLHDIELQIVARLNQRHLQFRSLLESFTELCEKMRDYEDALDQDVAFLEVSLGKARKQLSQLSTLKSNSGTTVVYHQNILINGSVRLDSRKL